MQMMRVRVYHNETIATRHWVGEYESDDSLSMVFEFTMPVCMFRDPVLNQDGTWLRQVFKEFNLGEGVLSTTYRYMGLRSLSKGDVVEIEVQGTKTWFICETVGWREDPRLQRG
jgi:hypothetical protein